MYKSLKVSVDTDLNIQMIILHLKKLFPNANHINKRGVVCSAINRYKNFLIEEALKKKNINKNSLRVYVELTKQTCKEHQDDTTLEN